MTEPTPPWVKPRIIAAPKIRQIYWCDFWQDARLPEMWKTRPVVIVSYKNTLNGTSLVAPLSTVPHDAKDKWAYKLPNDINGVAAWVICNQLSTVSTSRFSQFSGNIPEMSKGDFNQVIERIMKWLPVPFDIEK